MFVTSKVIWVERFCSSPTILFIGLGCQPLEDILRTGECAVPAPFVVYFVEHQSSDHVLLVGGKLPCLINRLVEKWAHWTVTRSRLVKHTLAAEVAASEVAT